MAKKIWTWIINHRDIVYIGLIVIGFLFFLNQCNSSSNLNSEVNRLQNNISALTDTLTQYKDENGKIIAEKHAYQLTQQELRDSVDLLKTKNREYLTYINATVGIRDTLEIPTYIERIVDNTTTYTDAGTIKLNQSDTFGKSSRNLSLEIPYTFDTQLNTGNANVNLSQNIYVESMIERDTKTGETYVRLTSDYPNMTFNSGMGVVVTNANAYDKSLRKTKGIGIGIGPSVGVSYDIINQKIVPTVGVSVTLGFTYTPKWAQW
jgi:hypothetical protein